MRNVSFYFGYPSKKKSCKKNKTAKMSTRICTSFHFPFASFTSGYVINPSEIPVEMLDVSGMERITRKAGNASSSSFQRIRDTEFIIKQPTMIKTGEVMDGKDEMA